MLLYLSEGKVVFSKKDMNKYAWNMTHGFVILFPLFEKYNFSLMVKGTGNPKIKFFVG